MAESNRTPRSHRFIDLTGKVFGRLTVLRFAGSSPRKHRLWECRCECGVVRNVRACTLLAGEAHSCGCGSREAASTNNLRHGCGRAGAKRTPEYQSWSGMIQRCTNPKNTAWKNYGARGITVCERWRDFANFLADMGDRPSLKHSIDRIENNKGYEPGNCAWATKLSQCRNTRKNVMLEFRGETKCLSEWAETLGVNRDALRTRIESGWSVEDALSTPVKQYRRRS